MREVFALLKKKSQHFVRRFRSRSKLDIQYITETEQPKSKKGRQSVLFVFLLAAFYIFSNGTGNRGRYTIDKFQSDVPIQDVTVDNNIVKDDFVISQTTTEEKMTTSSELEVATHSRRQRIQETNVDKLVDKVIQEINADKTANDTHTTQYNKTLPICELHESLKPPQISVNSSTISASQSKLYAIVKRGGHYKPPDCYSKDKVAILVPYRNRSLNLSTFLVNIHSFLMVQNLDYRIFVIEQYGTGTFNKGRLFNAGFKEMQKYGRWRCVIFHDVDLLPLSPSNTYSCPSSPRHLSSLVLNSNPKRNTSSSILFGGVTAMLIEHYKKANGHSNVYWGWGGEDYDMFWRLRAAGLQVARNSHLVGKYLSLPHQENEENLIRYRLLKTAQDRWQCEGLNTVRYRVVSATLRPLFTHVTVDVYQNGDPRGGHSNAFLSQLHKLSKFF